MICHRYSKRCLHIHIQISARPSGLALRLIFIALLLDNPFTILRTQSLPPKYCRLEFLEEYSNLLLFFVFTRIGLVPHFGSLIIVIANDLEVVLRLTRIFLYHFMKICSSSLFGIIGQICQYLTLGNKAAYISLDRSMACTIYSFLPAAQHVALVVDTAAGSQQLLGSLVSRNYRSGHTRAVSSRPRSRNISCIVYNDIQSRRLHFSVRQTCRFHRSATKT